MSEQSQQLKGPIIVVAGPPASGKGTQCKRIAEKFGLVHVSLGDICRHHSKMGTELGIKIKAHMDRGDMVPNDLAFDIVKDRLSHADVVQRGCLLDGFPRNGDQADAMMSYVEVDKFILFQVPDHVVIERALGRRMDLETGAIYHLKNAPPPAEIAHRLFRRDNDASEAIVRTRLELYHGQIGRILPQFFSKAQMVDATQTPDMVFEILAASLSKMQGINSVKQGSFIDEPGTKHGSVDGAIGIAPSPRSIEKESETAAMEPTAELSLGVALSRDIGNEEAECEVVVSVHVPDDESRAPVDICCVVDISGSMGTIATYEEEGIVKDDGLSILDIVKHAVKTVMHTLKDEDRLALVAFDDKVETVFSLSPMSVEGRESAIVALDALRPRGQTNLWGGILAGLEELRILSQDAGSRKRTLFLLTDGQPNISPPKGHLAELRKYKDGHVDFKFQMNTFGFGYSLDSALLLDLAVESHGTYAFIPDAPIVGTVFVNSLANVLSTHTQDAILHLTAQNGAEFRGPVHENHKVTETSWGRVVSLGPLQLGQSREVCVPMHVPAGNMSYLEAVLVYSSDGQESRAYIEAACRGSSPDAIAAIARTKTVSAGYEAVRTAAAGQYTDEVQALARCITGYEAASSGHEHVCALRADIEGRMSKALNGRERFDRWGKHYLRALMRAHQLQQCTNFMDHGLQVYGGSLFLALRDEGDNIFLTLPPPIPAKDETGVPCDLCGRNIPFDDYSAHIETCGNARPRARASPAPASAQQQSSSNNINMQTYYGGSGGGCFGESSSVMLQTSNGQLVRTLVSEVKPGDRVCVSDGIACVRCVVRISRSPQKGMVIFPGGLTITPGHPVRINGEWMRPRDVPTTLVTTNSCGCVYNFVLDHCHTLLVDGIECVTWGHGISGDVVGHPYFGSSRIISDLARLPGWEQGLLSVDGFFRDGMAQVTGLRASGIGVQDPGSCASEGIMFAHREVQEQHKCHCLPPTMMVPHGHLPLTLQA
eukprot:gnl/MRDRNA2_/MRDRNA2_72470_c0_seq1.p1 gnl/MRDRNA2_/MRDRNA2_72470_c0~~gnl/MRDRNA2_/MRDRNA2_72470_c0_seq1.p1  ORF type:complete len:1023 (-),score=174.32 gnl/MRDRNA2_/MRDRNA2_72470_c0_seq1:198-3188(-)